MATENKRPLPAAVIQSLSWLTLLNVLAQWSAARLEDFVFSDNMFCKLKHFSFRSPSPLVFFPPPNNVSWLSILEGAPEINSWSCWRALRIVLSFQVLRFNSFHKHHWKSSAGSKWTTIQLLVYMYPMCCLVFWKSLIILLHLPMQSLYIYWRVVNAVNTHRLISHRTMYTQTWTRVNYACTHTHTINNLPSSTLGSNKGLSYWKNRRPQDGSLVFDETCDGF